MELIKVEKNEYTTEDSKYQIYKHDDGITAVWMAEDEHSEIVAVHNTLSGIKADLELYIRQLEAHRDYEDGLWVEGVE